jgi:hypothetical protein
MRLGAFKSVKIPVIDGPVFAEQEVERVRRGGSEVDLSHASGQGIVSWGQER